MGAGASIDKELLSEAEVKALAGDKFDQEMFDDMKDDTGFVKLAKLKAVAKLQGVAVEVDTEVAKAAFGSLKAEEKGTREQNIELVKEQRRRASVMVIAQQESAAGAGRRQSRMALEPLDSSKLSRMSAIGIDTRKALIEATEVTSKQSPEGDPLDADNGYEELESRLNGLKMSNCEMEGDGNCQFRAFAFNLFGAQEHHATVREASVAHMTKHAEFFSIFFEGEAEFKSFLSGMAADRTWGDELTLRAVVEAYGCQAHVITSEPANWYLAYTPEGEVDSSIALVPDGVSAPPLGKEVFLSYVSPIHYNAIVAGVA